MLGWAGAKARLDELLAPQTKNYADVYKYMEEAVRMYTTVVERTDELVCMLCTV